MFDGNSKTIIQSLGCVSLSELGSPFEVWDGSDYQNCELIKSLEHVCKVNFYGGNSIVCSPNQELLACTSLKNLKWIKAKDLTPKHKAIILNTTPDFDFFPKINYQFLGKLTSPALGILLGVYYKFGTKLRDGFTLVLPEQDFELVRYVKNMLTGLSVEIKEQCLYKSGGNKISLSVQSLGLVEELESLNLRNGLKQDLWTSRVVIKGILCVLFEYCNRTKENFELKLDNHQLTKDLQSVLYLFGVLSKASKGLGSNRLLLLGDNVYKYFFHVGFINEDKVLGYLNPKKLSRFKRNKKNSLAVKEIRLTNRETEMYNVVSENAESLVINGVIARVRKI